ncbi:MAG: GDP-mannose 4,6-dehydratase [Anaerolineae bacterium]
MATYLVTGAAGFIGSRVSELLLDEGHAVVGIDNLNDAYDVRLKDWRLSRLLEQECFSFDSTDIVDRSALALVFDRQPGTAFDAVINLAARAGVRQSVSNPWAFMETNAIGTLNLLDLCRAHDVPKFVLASSSSLYGASEDVPYRETMDTSHPLSPYTASKKAAEALCYTYHHLYGMDTTIFRYFTVYGPGCRPDMAPFRFTQWICEGKRVTLYGDGSQQRDFTHVDDIAQGTILGLAPLGFEVINLGSSHPLSVNTVIHMIERLAGRTAELDLRPPNPADVRVTWADISKAERLLGWRPRLTAAEGFRTLVCWYLRNRAWASEIETR